MPAEPSNHQFRSLKKTFAKQEQRLELKELRRQRRIERSIPAPKSRRNYAPDPLEGDDIAYQDDERRRNKARPSTERFRAANIDQIVVVCSPLRPPFRPRLLDRYLVAASSEALPVVVCLNKVDLGIPGEVERYLPRYGQLAADLVQTSAVTGEGIATLRDRLSGRTSLLVGHSGVGKSSLLNALEPGLALRVGEVTQAAAGQGKGRHTTTSARLVPLSLPKTFVIDSPGIRAFGIEGIAPGELADHFLDIRALAGACLYRDCRHSSESGCEVARAAKGDWFLHERLESYHAMMQDIE